jgi:hypothetical protein
MLLMKVIDYKGVAFLCDILVHGSPQHCVVVVKGKGKRKILARDTITLDG